MNELVLVGGCAAGLLITDPAAESVRATIDVDLVLEVFRYQEYAVFERLLRERGFMQGAFEDDPICRWRLGELIIDVMPVGDFLGFSNRWYAGAVASKVSVELPSGLRISHIDAPHFLATKFEAFESRGKDDPAMSHDAEDVILVLDGRREIVSELAKAPVELQKHVAAGVGDLLADRLFMEAFEGYFDRSVAVIRAAIVQQRMKEIARF